VGQELTGIVDLAKALERRLKGTAPEEESDAERIASLVQEALADTRQIVKGLAPVDVDEEGLSEALKALARKTRNVFGVSCRCTVRKPGRVHDNVLATHLYYIAREAVSNALRHARAEHIRIVFSAGEKRGRLVIEDDGRGFRIDEQQDGGMGLRIMRYRSEVMGADLTVRSDRGRGTTVLCAFDNGRTQAAGFLS
jgi:signal transduction histidine kinase